MNHISIVKSNADGLKRFDCRFLNEWLAFSYLLANAIYSVSKWHDWITMWIYCFQQIDFHLWTISVNSNSRWNRTAPWCALLDHRIYCVSLHGAFRRSLKVSHLFGLFGNRCFPITNTWIGLKRHKMERFMKFVKLWLLITMSGEQNWDI